MTKIIVAIVFALFLNSAQASETLDRLVEFVYAMEESSSDVIESVQYTAVRGADKVTAISQFVWGEVRQATEELQRNIDSLQRKVDNHIYADKREHARLQAQINALKIEMAKLKAKQK